ncbi:MAG TPA: hypothetical protein VFK22_01200 [Candidatus Dormibacteraeota bacterium]|nr:hypothetical protein [Candidatus Dormibacteraeota bacterium]
MKLLVGLVAALILADLAFAGVLVTERLTSHSSSSPVAAQASTHPCNHGFYVSQAAHAKKGGKYVSSVAQGNLGKNGSCSAPLPK